MPCSLPSAANGKEAADVTCFDLKKQIKNSISTMKMSITKITRPET
jgi:hypothetical protein